MTAVKSTQRPLCTHCRRRRRRKATSGGRGLCDTCYRDPAVRDATAGRDGRLLHEPPLTDLERDRIGELFPQLRHRAFVVAKLLGIPPHDRADAAADAYLRICRTGGAEAADWWDYYRRLIWSAVRNHRTAEGIRLKLAEKARSQVQRAGRVRR